MTTYWRATYTRTVPHPERAGELFTPSPPFEWLIPADSAEAARARWEEAYRDHPDARLLDVVPARPDW